MWLTLDSSHVLPSTGTIQGRILILILGRVFLQITAFSSCSLGFATALSSFQHGPWGFCGSSETQPHIPGFLQVHNEGRLGAQGKPAASTSTCLLVLLCSAVTVCMKKWLFLHHRVAVLRLGSFHSGQSSHMLISEIERVTLRFSRLQQGIPHLQCCLHLKCIFTLPNFKQSSIESNLLLCSIAGVLVNSRDKRSE